MVRIAELKEGQVVEGFFALRDAALATTQGGKPFLKIKLGDATGMISGNYWDVPPETPPTLTVGEPVKVRATTESYRGTLQLKITLIRPAIPGDGVDPAQFLPCTPRDIGELQRELAALVSTVKNPGCSALLRAFFDDPEFLARYSRAPAARENHHAYVGGLLEHSVSMARLADAFCAASPGSLDRDLLLVGAFLHDVGKVEELGLTSAVEYTDAGRLVGHLVLGCLMIRERTRNLPVVSERTLQLVLHLVLSHHGKREYGSPVLPATPEALALHHLDNFDAKTFAARRLINADANVNSRWTERSFMLETALFKPGLSEEAPPSGPPAAVPPPAAPRAASAKKRDSATGGLFGNA